LERLAALGNPSREAELRADHLLKGMNRLPLRVGASPAAHAGMQIWANHTLTLQLYPDLELEDSSDYLDRMAELFSAAHGAAIKVAFAETLVRLLHALPKVSLVDERLSQQPADTSHRPSVPR
jgi:hypothetical protein